MTFDLTGIATATIAGVFAVLGIVLPLLINARIKDAQAAVTLGAAVRNSLGAIEQAATQGAIALKPSVTIPGVPPSVAVGVAYVLDHAGAEAARFGITPEAIAAKVSAQIGLAKIAADPAMLPVLIATAPKSAGPTAATAAPTAAAAAAAFGRLSANATIPPSPPPKRTG